MMQHLTLFLLFYIMSDRIVFRYAYLSTQHPVVFQLLFFFRIARGERLPLPHCCVKKVRYVHYKVEWRIYNIKKIMEKI